MFFGTITYIFISSCIIICPFYYCVNIRILNYFALTSKIAAVSTAAAAPINSTANL